MYVHSTYNVYNKYILGISFEQSYDWHRTDTYGEMQPEISQSRLPASVQFINKASVCVQPEWKHTSSLVR
jgi:hypothetical protein